MILITHLLASGLRLQQRLSQQTAEGIAESAYCQDTETKKRVIAYSDLTVWQPHVIVEYNRQIFLMINDWESVNKGLGLKCPTLKTLSPTKRFHHFCRWWHKLTTKPVFYSLFWWDINLNSIKQKLSIGRWSDINWI